MEDGAGWKIKSRLEGEVATQVEPGEDVVHLSIQRIMVTGAGAATMPKMSDLILASRPAR